MPDDEVYQQCAADAVQHMLQGKIATVFMSLGAGQFSGVYNGKVSGSFAQILMSKRGE